jgi:hypothetical protein
MEERTVTIIVAGSYIIAMSILYSFFYTLATIIDSLPSTVIPVIFPAVVGGAYYYRGDKLVGHVSKEIDW